MSDDFKFSAKLIPGGQGSYSYSLPDVRPVVDGRKMTATITISTQAIDRSREVVVTDGIRTKNHQSNPIVLVAHKKDMRCGVAEDRDSKAYSVKMVGPGRLDATTYFDQHTELGEHAFRLVETGTYRGASIGFFEVPNMVEKGHDKHGAPVRIIKECDLLEYSHLLIPDNQECIIRAVEKGFGGKPLQAQLKDWLTPQIKERAPVVRSGWEPTEADLESFDNEAVEPDDMLLTSSSQLYHACYEKAKSFVGLVENLRAVQELPSSKEDARRITALLGAVMELCEKGQGGHVRAYPDQPGAPGSDEPTEEQMTAWRVKAVSLWEEHLQEMEKQVASQDAGLIEDAVAYLNTLAADKTLSHRVRATARRKALDLKGARLVAPQAGADEATKWSEAAAILRNLGKPEANGVTA